MSDTTTRDQRIERLKDIYRDFSPDGYQGKVVTLRELLHRNGERVREAEKTIALAETEAAALQALLDELKPCVSCKGMGKLRRWTDQDSSHLEPCGRCGGDGRERS